jgi:hypothetical protein
MARSRFNDSAEPMTLENTRHNSVRRPPFRGRQKSV